MPETVRIPARFNGPPTTGHGGWSSGAIAALLGAGPIAVSLRAPPPLDVEMRVVREGERVTVFDGDTLVAIANAGAPSSDPPAAVSLDDALAARHDPEALLEIHPFPTCFGCGPLRADGDGLRLFAGPVHADPDERHAVPWTPPPESAGDDGDVLPGWIWAALDCPSGAPADAGTGGEAVVLARYLIELEAPVRAGEPHVIVSRLVRRDGRKRATAMGLYDDRGRRLARGESLWVKLG